MAEVSPRDLLLEEIAAEVAATASLTGRDRLSPRVLAALRKVPRERFVVPELEPLAYENRPLPIGHGQTISQPFMVAIMTELLDLAPTDRVLEIGTGSGYQAAVLAELAGRVYTVERVAGLAERARAALAEQGCANVECRTGDGRAGWPEAAPFDAIVVTAAAPAVPPALVEQLAPGGRLVVPVSTGGGWGGQELVLIVKDAAGRTRERRLFDVAFVPLLAGLDAAPLPPGP